MTINQVPRGQASILSIVVSALLANNCLEREGTEDIKEK